MKKFFEKIKETSKSIKSKININTGKVVERVFFWIVIITLLLFIPIGFTVFSTMMGAGTVSSTAYYAIFYTTWAFFFISLIVWRFFREFKFKDENEEVVSE